MMHVQSFSPIEDSSAVTLILGTMPGKVSLAENQYYAHPRNYFWKIIGSTLGFSEELPYRARCKMLIRNRIALWDVLKACTRNSSLDSDIVESSIVTNDFEGFFSGHPNIKAIYFNGAKAETIYKRRILPQLPENHANITTTRLPSTSPANASVPFPVKLAHWRLIAGTDAAQVR